MTRELFRREAIDHRRGRLYGEVALTTPLSVWMIAALLSAIAAAVHAAATEGGGYRPLFEASVAENTLYFSGKINSQSVEEVSRLLENRHPKNLVISSGGGITGSSLAFGKLVREHGLHVTVADRCHSGCANFIAPAAVTLTVSPGGLVGFHGGAPSGEIMSEREKSQARDDLLRAGVPAESISEIIESSEGEDLRMQKSLIRDIRAFYASIGVSPEIIFATSPHNMGLKRGQAVVFTKRALVECFHLSNIVAYPNSKALAAAAGPDFVVSDYCPPASGMRDEADADDAD